MPSHSPDEEHDAITAEEIAGTATPLDGKSKGHKRPNAFTELMKTSHSKRPKADPSEPRNRRRRSKASTKYAFDPRDALSEYIEHPERNPEDRVVEYDDDFVVIRDKYPKASVHLLLIPRSPEIYFKHPLRLLSTDAAFLSTIRTRVERLKTLAASELRRLYGQHSASDAPYQTALEELMSAPNPPPAEERAALLPPGRDWSKEIVAGVHTHPSMNHFHIHILSREQHSPCVKRKKHYLSFKTSFMVQLDEFPLEDGSPRFHPGDWPSWDMRCWRCDRNFGNRFKKLKEHLDDEFERWKRE